MRFCLGGSFLVGGPKRRGKRSIGEARESSYFLFLFPLFLGVGKWENYGGRKIGLPVKATLRGREKIYFLYFVREGKCKCEKGPFSPREEGK